MFSAHPLGAAAFCFDRVASLFSGPGDIREFIALPKNKAGKDVMIDAPSRIDDIQLKELGFQGRYWSFVNWLSSG
jgi:aspartyl-tRNA synthetase